MRVELTSEEIELIAQLIEEKISLYTKESLREQQRALLKKLYDAKELSELPL